jgi:HPt (histidine-containing phosphotransfer) domain-containing protein
MAQDKFEKPESATVATFADHEVIVPPNRLRKYISTVSGKGPFEDPVARAEKAMAKLSKEFGTWMAEESDRLNLAREQVKAQGFNKATREALFHVAHDIKGEAATFGFPKAAAPADSLCRLIEHTPDITRIPFTLLDQHVDAVRAIIRESGRADIDIIAQALTQRLRDVTDEFLAHENRDRPEYLEGIVSPSLVPGRQD